MKFRQDFVTNSSSSSYICVSKVNKNDELINYFKEEYGKYGIKIMDKYLIPGKEIKEEIWEYEEFLSYCKDWDIEIADDDMYLQARFYVWCDDGDGNGDDAWLYDKIPPEYMEEVYEGEAG